MKLKKLCSIALVFGFIFLFSGFEFEKPDNIKINAVSAVVIDQGTGRILYSRSSDRRLPMASTTKIMTALVAIEKGNLKDRITVSQRAASVSGSKAGLKAGEVVTLEELLYGLMLRSGNDAAIAVAEHIGGSSDKFIDMMNDRAIEEGLMDTHFVTPHGLDSGEHYTTAEDLAKLSAAAMRNSMFSKIVSTKQINSGVTGVFNRSYSNINKFLYRVKDADGIKTGYTGGAGKCLVASAVHDYGRYICVILNSPTRWADAEKLISYAASEYTFKKLIDRNQKLTSVVSLPSNKSIDICSGVDVYYPQRNKKAESIRIGVYIPSKCYISKHHDTRAGDIAIYIDGKLSTIFPLSIKTKNQ